MEEFPGLTKNSRATVIVEIEVFITDNWGGDATVQQIHAQAKESALGMLRNRLEAGHYRVIGNPTVKAIITELKQ